MKTIAIDWFECSTFNYVELHSVFSSVHHSCICANFLLYVALVMVVLAKQRRWLCARVNFHRRVLDEESLCGAIVDVDTNQAGELNECKRFVGKQK